MQHKLLRFAAVVAAAILAVPAGAATWYAYGSYEPSTSLDTPTLMWPDAPASGGRVYFNAFTTTGGVFTSQSGVNPNNGVLQSDVELAGQESHYAVLGVWTDCNGDGYVGMAETAVREYPAEALDATSGSARCPPTSNPAGFPNCYVAVRPCPSWAPTGYNNFNGWVTELIPIGGVQATGGDNRVIRDAEARVWGDYGRPDDAAAETAGGTCALQPLPRGTAQSTGGALNYLDCQTGIIALLNSPWETAGADPLGLTFADETDGRSGALGQVETLGDDDASNAIVQTGDCSSDPLVASEDTPLGEDNAGDGVRAPNAGYLNPGGNVAGTVNHTMESAPLPTRQSSGSGGPDSTSNCDFEDDRGEDVYDLVEDDFQGVSTTHKTEADWTFAFQTMTRGGAPLGLVKAGAAGAPSDAGIEAVSALGGASQTSMWITGEVVTKGIQTVTLRNDLDLDAPDAGQVGVDVAPGYWLSFYASLGPTSRDLGVQLPGGEGTYGAAQCGANQDGTHNGWECDVSRWYVNGDGSPQPEPTPFSRPGQPYQLRDVDCHDGGVRALAVGVQPAFYGEDACLQG